MGGTSLDILHKHIDDDQKITHSGGERSREKNFPQASCGQEKHGQTKDRFRQAVGNPTGKKENPPLADAFLVLLPVAGGDRCLFCRRILLFLYPSLRLPLETLLRVESLRGMPAIRV